MSLHSSIMVHDLALCESDEVGAGTRIWAFAHVLAGAVIGERCNLGDHVFIEGEARLGDDVTVKNGVSVWDHVTIGDRVFVGPGVVFTNDRRPRIETQLETGDFVAVPTDIGAGATLGAGAIILCGVSVGPCAFVAAGSLVSHSVAAHALVMGSPARFVRWVCTCGQDLDAELVCSCGRRYKPEPDGDGLTER